MKKSWILNANTREIHELHDGKPKDARCEIGSIAEEHSITTDKKHSIHDILEEGIFDACAWCKPLGFESKR